MRERERERALNAWHFLFNKNAPLIGPIRMHAKLKIGGMDASGCKLGVGQVYQCIQKFLTLDYIVSKFDSCITCRYNVWNAVGPKPVAIQGPI